MSAYESTRADAQARQLSSAVLRLFGQNAPGSPMSERIEKVKALRWHLWISMKSSNLAMTKRGREH